MKKQKIINKKIDILVCDICGKEISPAVLPYRITTRQWYDVFRGIFGRPHKDRDFYFHYECVNKTLFQKMKEISKINKN